MQQFLSFGNKVDELSYFKTLLGDMRMKTKETPYTERKAFELESSGDISLEKEFQSAMEEVSAKEKDFAQLFQMTEFLFEKHDELQGRVSELTALNQNYLNLEEEMHQKQMTFAEDLQEKIQRLNFF